MTALIMRVAAILFILGGSTQAADYSPADMGKIAKCMAPFDAKGAFGAKCVGLIADPCIAAIKNKQDGNFSKQKACATRELRVWEALMQPTLADVVKAAFPDIQKAVDETQKTWMLSRDALCPFYDVTELGPRQGGSEYCRLQETAKRIRLLRSLSWSLAHRNDRE